MGIKMVVTDLDNTLLRTDKTISEYTKAVFERLREQGVMTAFATSRPERFTARYKAILGPDINITSGGAIAKLRGETLFRAAIPIGAAAAIIRELLASGAVTELAADTEHSYFCTWQADPDGGEWSDSAIVTTDFSEPPPVPDVFKITPGFTDVGIFPAILARYPTVDMRRFTGEGWCEIKSRAATKQRAVAAVCERLGVSLSEVAAFGDDHNDVEMLRDCGMGVAVSNGIPEVKAIAASLCDPSDNDGVARWIERHILA